MKEKGKKGEGREGEGTGSELGMMKWKGREIGTVDVEGR